jgi:ABC-type antimicrobial peptide transport system permease subunit
MVAFLQISRILSFDRFHRNYDRLYAVEANVTYFNNDRFPKQVLSASLTETLKSVPEIGSLARVASRSYEFVNGDIIFTESGIYADKTFMEMFSFPLSSGTVSDESWEMKSIFISERMAIKFYGSADCIGKTIFLSQDGNQQGYNIAGIITNVPARSSFQFDFMIPFSRFLAEYPWANETGASANQIWALLNNNADALSVNEKIRDLIKDQETTLNQELFLFPLKEKALYSYAGGKRIWHGMQYVVISGVLGLAILLIACFNYVNLAISMNIRRYREAGIRKAMGAKRSTILLQFLTETYIITLASFIIAVDLVKLLTDIYNTRFNGDLHLTYSDFRLILVFAGIAILTGLISGLLPGLYLSSSNPVTTLKGKIVTSHSFSGFRQSLIIFQFTIPVIFIICMMIVRVQDKFIREYDMGFDKNKLLIINSSEQIEAHEESFKADLLSIPGIETVSLSNCIPAYGAAVTNEIMWEGRDASLKLHFWSINTDYDYCSAVNLRIKDGRYFNRSFPADSDCYVINDIAAGVMNYDDPVGRTLTLNGKKGTIIGVFTDFHTLDLSGPFTPTIISLSPDSRDNILIKLSEGTFSSVTERIGTVYKKYEPELLFQAQTFSDLRERTELTTVSNLIGVAFVIALLLACLGLSGLASFTAESRSKEIGIRKINGATTLLMISLLGKNYTKWLIISIIIALPLSFFIGNIFLARFNFRASIPVWTFIAGPLIAYIIALSVVSWQSWRAATRNPVEALRYE